VASRRSRSIPPVLSGLDRVEACRQVPWGGGVKIELFVSHRNGRPRSAMRCRKFGGAGKGMFFAD